MIAESIKERQGHEGALRATEIPVARITPEARVDHRRKAAVLPNPEVADKAVRRRFTVEYKLRILNQAALNAITTTAILAA